MELDEEVPVQLKFSPVFRLRTLALVVGLLAVLVCPPIEAQSSLHRLEFSFSNPGARSMGFGGAFVALADDPTAAFANPAGLVQLARPEVFLDVRLGFESDEASSTFSFEEGSTDVTNLSFLSFVYPVGRCSLSVYGHQMVKADIANLGELPEDEALRALDISRYAVAGACRLLDELSIGAGASYFDASYRVLDRKEEGSDWGFNAGVLWHPADRLSVGAFFREGPGLDIDGGASGTLALPDTYGLGAAIRSKNGRFTLSAEWDHVGWSAMFQGVHASVASSEQAELVDVDELHLGGEYAWTTQSKVIALRLGVWRDPDHVMQRSGEDDGQTRYHGAAGFGMAWKHFQLDLAIDVSSDFFTLSASGMYVF